MDEIKNSFSFNVQIIEFDCPFEQLENPVARKVLSDLLHMRKRGYLSRHRSGALPIDTYDFVGTHYLMVVEEPEGFRILGCVRMVKLSKVKFYNLPFPLLSLLNSAKAERHLKSLNELFELQKNQPSLDFTYVSSWSFDPAVRKNPELVEHLYSLFAVINVKSHTTPQEEIRVACGIPRLKTDQYITNVIGYERIADAEGVLPEVLQSNLVDEPVVVLALKDGHPFTYRKLAQPVEKIWENRLVLIPDSTEKKQAA